MCLKIVICIEVFWDIIRDAWSDMSDVGDRRRRERRPKVVVLKELHRAIIYTTKMGKQVTKSHVRDAVHMYPVN
jgi:hypothetical protein